MARRKRTTTKTVPAVLDDQEYAFIYNFLGSEHVSVPGPQNTAVAVIRQKLAAYLQGTPQPEAPNGNSPDTAE